MDVYFSADVETDGPIPGPFSMLSFALVYAGSFDGETFVRPYSYEKSFYRELKPISEKFQQEALDINGLDREHLKRLGTEPYIAMQQARDWVLEQTKGHTPVLVAYPLSFDWSWLYWYFTQYCEAGSPFSYSHCYDIKTAYAVKANLPISSASRSKLLPHLQSNQAHTHHAIDDAIEQAGIFANIFEWSNKNERIAAKAS